MMARTGYINTVTSFCLLITRLPITCADSNSMWLIWSILGCVSPRWFHSKHKEGSHQCDLMPRLSVQEDVGIERTTRHCSGSYRQAFIGCCRVSSSAQYNAQLHQFVISQIPELLPSPNGFESPLTDEDSQRIPKMRFLTSEFATIVD
jgi:hypothetical protein